MTDQPRRFPFKTAFYCTALAVLTILPVFAVNSTSTGMRVTWLSTLLILGFGCLVVYLQTKDDPELQYKGAYFYNRQPMITAIMVALLSMATILAIAATYATPERPLLWQACLFISSIGDAVFPLVGKYATRAVPPLPPQALTKVQTVTTLFLTVGAISVLLMVPHIVLMPQKDVLYLEKVETRMGSNRWLAKRPVILLPFAILAGFAFFLGWFEFDPQPDYLARRKCFMQAVCYAHDDLLLIATGYMRIFGSYGFWLAGLITLVRAAQHESEQAGRE